MEITIKQRDSSKMSQDTANQVGDIWDVYQGEVLVGVYHNESDAKKYKELLESNLLDQLPPLKTNSPEEPPRLALDFCQFLLGDWRRKLNNFRSSQGIHLPSKLTKLLNSESKLYPRALCSATLIPPEIPPPSHSPLISAQTLVRHHHKNGEQP